MASPVEQIKQRLNIVEIVQSYLKLEKAGVNYRARCPFHNERTPSFYVSPTRQTYHCFGCNRGGDLISFVQEIEKLDFLGALETLADRAGVTLERVDPKLRSEEERSRNLLAEAANFYQVELGKNQEAHKYLVDRGLKPETIKDFQIGFAPNGWQNLINYLQTKGFTQNEMEKAGMVIVADDPSLKSRKRLYDRFRSRIMFPLADQSGRIVGFSGRIFGSADESQAKYINTPETRVYDKSQVLYGYHLAKQAIKGKDRAVLVEGQMDLVLSHQSGVTEAVAVSGTALTSKHLSLLKRLTNNLLLAFDSDQAGVNAFRRAVSLSLAEGLDVQAVPISSGKDPADLIREKPDSWTKSVEQAVPIVEFLLRDITARKLEGLARSRTVGTEVLPLIAVLPRQLDQAHYVKIVADYLGTAEEPVWAELKKVQVADVITEIAEPAAEKPDDNRLDRLLDQIFGFFWWQTGLSENKVLPEDATKALEGCLEKDFNLAEERRKPKRDRLALEAELMYQGIETLPRVWDDLIIQLKLNLTQSKLEEALVALKSAEKAGDKAQVSASLKRCQELSAQFNELKVATSKI